MTTRPPFTQATRAAESLNLTRIELLDLARVGKLTAWIQPVQMGQDGREIPLVVRCGRRQQTPEGIGRKLAMPDGQYLIFDPSEPMSVLKGNGWLDLSILTKENHALLESAYLMPDGVPVELKTDVVLGDGSGNFYEVAWWPTLRMMAFVGFMTKDIEALRAAPYSATAPAHESITDRDARWLALFDQEELSNPREAQSRTCKLVYERDGVLPDTVKAALQGAKKKRAESYRQGGAVTLSKQKGKDKNPAHAPFGTGKKKS